MAHFAWLLCARFTEEERATRLQICKVWTSEKLDHKISKSSHSRWIFSFILNAFCHFSKPPFSFWTWIFYAIFFPFSFFFHSISTSGLSDTRRDPVISFHLKIFLSLTLSSKQTHISILKHQKREMEIMPNEMGDGMSPSLDVMVTCV